MRYEVQKQIEEINKALGTITMYQIPNMKISKEEMNEALKRAESCMQLMMITLSKKDETMREFKENLSNKEELFSLNNSNNFPTTNELQEVLDNNDDFEIGEI